MLGIYLWDGNERPLKSKEWVSRYNLMMGGGIYEECPSNFYILCKKFHLNNEAWYASKKKAESNSSIFLTTSIPQ